MCGIFGWFGTNAAARPDPRVLRAVALATLRRGADAWGVAWVDGEGRLHALRQCGSIGGQLELLRRIGAEARAMIGHCRYATHGAPEENINNHPHPCDGGWLVHNGVVSNHVQLNRDYELLTSSACDSETLGLLIERLQGGLRRRVRDAAVQARGALAVLGLWGRPARLIAVRRGNPLHMMRTGDGVWLASLSDGMGGAARMLDNDQGVEITNVKGTYHVEFFAADVERPHHSAGVEGGQGAFGRDGGAAGDFRKRRDPRGAGLLV